MIQGELKKTIMSYTLKTKVEVVTVETVEIQASLPQYVAYQVKYHREKLGLSPAELSRKSCPRSSSTPLLSNSVINSVERGESYPNLRTMELLAKVLEVEISTLVP